MNFHLYLFIDQISVLVAELRIRNCKPVLIEPGNRTICTWLTGCQQPVSRDILFFQIVFEFCVGVVF